MKNTMSYYFNLMVFKPAKKTLYYVYNLILHLATQLLYNVIILYRTQNLSEN